MPNPPAGKHVTLWACLCCTKTQRKLATLLANSKWPDVHLVRSLLAIMLISTLMSAAHQARSPPVPAEVRPWLWCFSLQQVLELTGTSLSGNASCSFYAIGMRACVPASQNAVCRRTSPPKKFWCKIFGIAPSLVAGLASSSTIDGVLSVLPSRGIAVADLMRRVVIHTIARRIMKLMIMIDHQAVRGCGHKIEFLPPRVTKSLWWALGILTFNPQLWSMKKKDPGLCQWTHVFLSSSEDLSHSEGLLWNLRHVTFKVCKLHNLTLITLTLNLTLKKGLLCLPELAAAPDIGLGCWPQCVPFLGLPSPCRFPQCVLLWDGTTTSFVSLFPHALIAFLSRLAFALVDWRPCLVYPLFISSLMYLSLFMSRLALALLDWRPFLVNPLFRPRALAIDQSTVPKHKISHCCRCLKAQFTSPSFTQKTHNRTWQMTCQ